MRHRRWSCVEARGLFLLLTGVITVACAPLPAKDPDPTLSTPRTSDFARGGSAPWPTQAWWQALHDPQLDRLITQALAGAPGMAIAQARVQQALAGSEKVAANGGVDIAANAQLSRQRYPQYSIYPPSLGGSYATSGNLRLDFSNDFDFWGRNRGALEAALGRHAAVEAEAAGAANTLATAIARAYYQWQGIDTHLGLMRDIEARRRQLLQLERQRVDNGITAASALHPLAADVAMPRHTRVQLETRRQQVFYQLQALVGGAGAFPELKPVALPKIQDEVPANLSVDLLARRPDIAAARDRVQAALKGVEATRAAFYPNISFTAFIGLDAIRAGHLLRTGSEALGATPAIHLPIFDAGRLHAALAGERADLALTVAQYEQAVLTAVGEVNDAIVRLQGSERERPALEQQVQARQHDLESINQRKRAGLADQREALRLELLLFALKEQALNQHLQSLAAQVDLVKALGGGYRAPDDPPPP